MRIKLSTRLCSGKATRYSPPGRVAQLGEQRTLNPPVAGSSPAALTKKAIDINRLRPSFLEARGFDSHCLDPHALRALWASLPRLPRLRRS